MLEENGASDEMEAQGLLPASASFLISPCDLEKRSASPCAKSQGAESKRSSLVREAGMYRWMALRLPTLRADFC